MNKIAVVYKSKYGHTKKYAEWISDELNCDLYVANKTDIDALKGYNTIIYGGGLYASGIIGVGLITKNYEALKDKKLIVFTVGLADPNIKSQFKPIIDKNFTEEMKKSIEIFHLHGGIDYSELNIIHKSMMNALKKMVEKKKEDQKTEEDRTMLETYGGVVDFTDKKSIQPIIAAANN